MFVNPSFTMGLFGKRTVEGNSYDRTWIYCRNNVRYISLSCESCDAI